MKDKKLLKVYLSCFSFISFFCSLLYISEIIDKLNLPKGIISAVVNYLYLIVHGMSFLGMLFYGKELLSSAEKR